MTPPGACQAGSIPCRINTLFQPSVGQTLSNQMRRRAPTSRLPRCSLNMRVSATLNANFGRCCAEVGHGVCGREVRLCSPSGALNLAQTWSKHVGKRRCLWLPVRQIGRTQTQTLTAGCHSVPLGCPGSSPVVPAIPAPLKAPQRASRCCSESLRERPPLYRTSKSAQRSDLLPALSMALRMAR